MSGEETSSVLRAQPLVVGTVHSPACVRAALQIQPDEIDLVELRVDHFANSPETLEKAANHFRVPVIITVRHPSEGGQNRLSPRRRLELYTRFLPWAAFLDTELRSIGCLGPVLQLARERGVRLILSEHHFRFTPSLARLQATLRGARAGGADICKVAARADNVLALQRLLALLARPPSTPLSLMSMGRFGKISRVLFGQAGSVLNYGYLSAPNASGQWHAPRLKERLRELEN